MGRQEKVVPHEDGEAVPLGARLRIARNQAGITLTQMALDLSPYQKPPVSR